ncbi:ctd nuclear envelope phosphatase [Anaeramoeba flamelloides]|uniref:Ctd nuclear envelope phosphatase n=1 Tax=Anaeramoeba flamelloides TaxID=1746091 RepID=A0AAV8A9X0_9EUKA|nr:ctd nuclear envelope phosphatase [Anaeramoeba flamelloides]
MRTFLEKTPKNDTQFPIRMVMNYNFENNYYWDLYFETGLIQEKLSRRNKITLVLDLDETLIHSNQIRLPGLNYDFTVSLKVKEAQTMFYVYKRPHVSEFLSQISKWFNIVIYTSSVQEYADPIIDFLDPNGYIKDRLYRCNCEQMSRNWIKDLSCVTNNFKKCVLVDNSPLAFSRNWKNGIQIKTWFGNPLDRELVKLLTFLDALRSLKDVRHILEYRKDWN